MTDIPQILIIDDEPDICELLALTLKRMGIDSDIATTYQSGIQLINKNTYMLVLTDMRLPDGEGIDIVKHVQINKPQTPIAVITAYGHVEEAVNTLKAGAIDYISKPIKLDMLRALIDTAIKLQQLPTNDEERLLGNSEAMHKLKGQISKLSRSQAPVFIYGESGVGKELVARQIHALSPRADNAFIAVNCGAIPQELMESEFFGHKKGSFTGAIDDKDGLFAAAHHGTLFLDEIAELPLNMQVKLLRAIQEKAIKPVGSTHEIAVDVRILSASNQDLKHEISEKRFREELYYRINVIELFVPALKDREGDISILAQAIIKKFGKNTYQLSNDALKVLESYHFPGNVRELENILERALTMCESAIIKPDDLQLQLNSDTQTIPEKSLPSSDTNLDSTLEQHEKTLIIDALEKNKWNRTAAAKQLGVSLRTLRYRLKKLDIE